MHSVCRSATREGDRYYCAAVASGALPNNLIYRNKLDRGVTLS